MAIEPHIHEYEITAKMEHTATGLRIKPLAVCTHPECDHELDAEGIILGLNASACIDQEQALELETIVTGEANATGTEYLERFDLAHHLRRYAANLTPVTNVLP